MQYVKTRNFYVKMGLFWGFSENGTPEIYFFKKSFEIFSLVLFCICSCVVRKKGLFYLVAVIFYFFINTILFILIIHAFKGFNDFTFGFKNLER